MYLITASWTHRACAAFSSFVQSNRRYYSANSLFLEQSTSALTSGQAESGTGHLAWTPACKPTAFIVHVGSVSTLSCCDVPGTSHGKALCLAGQSNRMNQCNCCAASHPKRICLAGHGRLRPIETESNSAQSARHNCDTGHLEV